MRRLDYIAHYGVLGQKWGVRKDSNGESRSFNKKELDQVYKYVRKRDRRTKVRKAVVAAGSVAVSTYLTRRYISDPEFRSKVNSGAAYTASFMAKFGKAVIGSGGGK